MHQAPSFRFLVSLNVKKKKKAGKRKVKETNGEGRGYLRGWVGAGVVWVDGRLACERATA